MRRYYASGWLRPNFALIRRCSQLGGVPPGYLLRPFTQTQPQASAIASRRPLSLVSGTRRAISTISAAFFRHASQGLGVRALRPPCRLTIGDNRPTRNGRPRFAKCRYVPAEGTQSGNSRCLTNTEKVMALRADRCCRRGGCCAYLPPAAKH